MAFQPMPLSRKPAPFDHPEWIFELKYDRFRSLAVTQNGRCQLISRNGDPFSSFSSLQRNLAPIYAEKTVLYGEIVCLNKKGKPQFRDLLFHRGEPCFFAFDVLMSEGKDLRRERLTDRKHELRRLLSRRPESARLRYADHMSDTALHSLSESANWTWKALSRNMRSESTRLNSQPLGSRLKSWLLTNAGPGRVI